MKNWARSDVIAAASLVVAVSALGVSVVLPELRQILGLDPRVGGVATFFQSWPGTVNKVLFLLPVIYFVLRSLPLSRTDKVIASGSGLKRWGASLGVVTFAWLVAFLSIGIPLVIMVTVDEYFDLGLLHQNSWMMNLLMLLPALCAAVFSSFMVWDLSHGA